MDKIRNRVNDLGTRTDDMIEMLCPHSTQLSDQERRLQAQEVKLADLEDRSRLNNVCILRLPEGTKTNPVEQFLESWLTEILPELGNAVEMAVDRGHRTPGGKPKPGALLRMAIMRIPQYKDKMNILAEAQKNTVEYKGKINSFYSDYGVATQRRRTSFMEVKCKPRDKGLN
ncbi:hypothetical protein NDU88_006139 [Pleurodeles waltl]|uniref:Uncharacterized protein n=1 Tax=Pleurodeles waltl TaxID=8319 RepID=A0AAV7TWS3_PLEWA|nr:hypothetical protein NDU88_006139 [Pleurodeles waltl]